MINVHTLITSFSLKVQSKKLNICLHLFFFTTTLSLNAEFKQQVRENLQGH